MEPTSVPTNVILKWIGSIWSWYRKRGRDGLGPAQVVVRWNKALVDGDLQFVEAHTYLSTPEARAYLAMREGQKEWTSLRELSDKYRAGRPAKSRCRVVNESVDERSWTLATVKYEVFYEGGERILWEDTLVREDDVWQGSNTSWKPWCIAPASRREARMPNQGVSRTARTLVALILGGP